MNNSLKILIHRGNTIYDQFYLKFDSVNRSQICSNTNQHKKSKLMGFSNYIINDDKEIIGISLRNKKINAYLVSAYIYNLRRSNVYRISAFKKLLEYYEAKIQTKCLKWKLCMEEPLILIKLYEPNHQFLDYNWNEKIMHMVLEQREVQYAMSWLSTLGGAFSALGEEFTGCAKMAGKISVAQFQLALRLGNPLLVARCNLYTALSLIQQGDLKTPKLVIKKIYKFAIHEKDDRLQNMCKGVWAKLKYCHKKRILNK
ncbi:uncharacterized protein F58A4.6 [Prorops nasuta]|uniref:uncharacterized protein F58A4.6 n=1 Tax=Prorops nasuta TaxID=863751 RepID=UPI0034CF4F69